MNAVAEIKAQLQVRHEALRIGGEKIFRDEVIEVRNPYDGTLVGTVPKATLEDVRRAFEFARAYRPALTRYERAAILRRAADAVRARTEEIAAVITAEAGLCKKDSIYEAGRVADVLVFGAGEVLKDDGQIFSCDLTPHGKKRRVYTQRDPLLGVISAITPFNHPMNQVAHKIVPSIATNNRIVVKPSEKVPLSCYLLADILYEAGLPVQMLQVLTGDPSVIADELITNPAIDLITFTGGVSIGKSIASRMGYRRAVLELGGNDPIIVMEDADLDEASSLAVSGSYKNSGQRCTAIKRMLVHESVADRFTDLVVEKTRAWKYGNPADSSVDMGTVIDEAAAQFCERQVNDALSRGARLLAGNLSRGRALLADGGRPCHARHAARQVRDVRTGVADHALCQHRRSDPHVELHGLRVVIVGLHESLRLHHAVHHRTGSGQRECARSAGVSARTHAVRRREGLGTRLQGRGAGGHEELYQYEDLFAAVVSVR